jgi:hypothetical protein
MLRTVFLIAFALAVAIGGGAASAWYMIDRGVAFGAVSVGPWTAFPDRGTPAADPYSRARFARTGDLSLGQAEGIVFSARRDSGGTQGNRFRVLAHNSPIWLSRGGIVKEPFKRFPGFPAVARQAIDPLVS